MGLHSERKSRYMISSKNGIKGHHKTQSEEAYFKIRDAIMYGKLKPGERLIETNVCETFNIGRTPMREAIRRLQMEDYVNIIPNKGTLISEVSIRDVQEIYDIISILEGYATEVAITRLTSAHFKELYSLHSELKKAGLKKDYVKWLEKNAFFHDFFPKVSDNLHLSKVIRSLRDRIYRYRYIAITIPGYIQEYILAHEKILEALSDKKPRQAGEAMRKHVCYVKDVLMDFLENSPWL